MRKYRTIYTILTSILMSFFFLITSLSSQSMTTKNNQEITLQINSTISELLAAEGFQNIEVHRTNNKTIVRYENRRYRYEVEAIKNTLSLVNKTNISPKDTLILVSKRWNIPLVSIELIVEDYQHFIDKKITAETFGQRLIIKNQSAYTRQKRINKTVNSGNYRIEIEIEPQLRLALGGYPDRVAHQINLIPRANMYLWKGAKLTFGGILPISDELGIEEEKMIRPEVLSLSQYMRLPANSYAGLSLGYFTKYRYGSQAELGKFFLNGNLLIRGKVGYTGYASYPKRLFLEKPEKGWQRANLEYLDYAAGIEYRYSKWDVRAGVEYGKAQFDKRYLRVNLTRQINEMEIGFFAFKTTDGENYGVHVALPIYPKKYWKPKAVSIRPARQFKYTYHGDQYYLTEYKTGANLADLHFQLNPSFIKNRLLE